MIPNLLVSILASVGLIQGFLLAIYLFFSSSKSNQGNLFLGIAILGVSIRILKSVVNYHVPLGAELSSLGLAGILLTGPSLLFYVRYILFNTKFQRSQLVHFIPFALFIALTPVIAELFQRYLSYWIATVHLGAYLLLAFRVLYQSRLSTSAVSRRWVASILTGMMVVWVFYFLNLVKLNPHYLSGPVYYSFVIYGFTFLFLNRKFPSSKYDSSRLSSTKSSGYYQDLLRLFDEKQVYLQPELSLEGVAKEMQVSPRILSQVINENAGKNFKSFVNQYRINKAKTLLSNGERTNDKIATIAYESGFSNVTSFNLAFKKVTGNTPSEFKRVAS